MQYSASRCYVVSVRTTVALADEVAAAVEQLRRSEGIGVSEAINRLVREGLAKPEPTARYVHQSYDPGPEDGCHQHRRGPRPARQTRRRTHLTRRWSTPT